MRMSDITGRILILVMDWFLLFKRKFWKFRLLVSKLLIKYLDKWYIQKSLVDFCKQQLSEQKHKGDLKTNKILFDLYDEKVSNSIKFGIE